MIDAFERAFEIEIGLARVGLRHPARSRSGIGLNRGIRQSERFGLLVAGQGNDRTQGIDGRGCFLAHIHGQQRFRFVHPSHAQQQTGVQCGEIGVAARFRYAVQRSQGSGDVAVGITSDALGDVRIADSGLQGGVIHQRREIKRPLDAVFRTDFQSQPRRLVARGDGGLAVLEHDPPFGVRGFHLAFEYRDLAALRPGLDEELGALDGGVDDGVRISRGLGVRLRAYKAPVSSSSQDGSSAFTLENTTVVS